jgi:hypothetical protein
MTQKVMIGMPMRDRPQAETSFSLLEMQRGFDKARIPHKILYTVGDSILPKTRNAFVAKFLASDYTDLIMLDDDVVWEEGAVNRLLSHKCEVVAGLYPKREETLVFPCRRKPGAPFDPVTGLLEMELVPTGFLRMTRSCLERMVASYPDLAYRDYDLPNKQAHALFWFDLAPDPDDPSINTIWGEDFSFCRKWRAIGGQIFADTLLHFKHIGQKAFSGCYAEVLPVSEILQREAAE